MADAGAGGAAGQGLLARGIAPRRSRVGRPLAAGGAGAANQNGQVVEEELVEV